MRLHHTSLDFSYCSWQECQKWPLLSFPLSQVAGRNGPFYCSQSPRLQAEMASSIIPNLPGCRQKWPLLLFPISQVAGRNGLFYRSQSPRLQAEMASSVVPNLPGCRQKWPLLSFPVSQIAGRNGLFYHSKSPRLWAEMASSAVSTYAHFSSCLKTKEVSGTSLLPIALGWVPWELAWP